MQISLDIIGCETGSRSLFKFMHSLDQQYRFWMTKVSTTKRSTTSGTLKSEEAGSCGSACKIASGSARKIVSGNACKIVSGSACKIASGSTAGTCKIATD
jgi:hypothetical protein